MNFAAAIFAASTLAASGPQEHRSLTALDTNRILVAQSIPLPIPQLDIPTPPPTPPPRSSKDELARLRRTVAALTEALALANSEAEVFKRQSTDMALRLEAFGVTGLDANPDKIEGRLIAAVRDLRLAQERQNEAEAQLLRLVEAIQLLIASTENIDPQLRMGVETEIRKTNLLLGEAPPNQPAVQEPSLTDAMVSDVNAELSLVIANVGERHGVKVGMPFLVTRDGSLVGSVRVVDVRDALSGAIVQSLEEENNPVKEGDRLRVDARR
jgi:hypothetical protein